MPSACLFLQHSVNCRNVARFSRVSLALKPYVCARFAHGNLRVFHSLQTISFDNVCEYSLFKPVPQDLTKPSPLGRVLKRDLLENVGRYRNTMRVSDKGQPSKEDSGFVTVWREGARRTIHQALWAL